MIEYIFIVYLFYSKMLLLGGRSYIYSTIFFKKKSNRFMLQINYTYIVITLNFEINYIMSFNIHCHFS